VLERFLEKNVTKFEMLCKALPADVNWGDPITPDVVEQIILAEREACAKLCETTGEFMAARYGDGAECITTGEECAENIRMRSNA
jgi:hypothetical protein